MLPGGALGVTEVDADIRRDGELPMVSQLRSPIPSQRRHQSLRQVLHLPDQGSHDAVAVLAVHLDQHDKTRTAFDQGSDVAVL